MDSSSIDNLNESLTISLTTSNLDDNMNSQFPELLFDRNDVRVVFLILYLIVCLICVAGNLLVILVITLHWRMRSSTNFCMANLAFADLCVGIFCIMQTISVYLMKEWIFGNILCKMYYFINRLSHTASISILILLSMERYLAIVYPLKSKQIMTPNRLKVVILLAWVISAVYSMPRFIFFHTFEMKLSVGGSETLCVPDMTSYNHKIFDVVHMTIVFIVPLIILTVLYLKIALILWKSTKLQVIGFNLQKRGDSNGHTQLNQYHQQNSIEETDKQEHFITLEQLSDSSSRKSKWIGYETESRGASCSKRNNLNKRDVADDDENIETELNNSVSLNKMNEDLLEIENIESIKGSRGSMNCEEYQIIERDKSSTASTNQNNITNKMKHKNKSIKFNVKNSDEKYFKSKNVRDNENMLCRPKCKHNSKVCHSASNPLKSRKRVIRMLIIIVIAFTACNLPYHARKLWQIWGVGYDGTSNFSVLFTVITFLIMYSNSAINPIIFYFMSKNFRLSCQEFFCTCIKDKHHCHNDKTRSSLYA